MLLVSVQMNLTSAAEFYGYTRFYKLMEVSEPHLTNALFSTHTPSVSFRRRRGCCQSWP